MKTLATVRINIGLRRWRKEEILIPDIIGGYVYDPDSKYYDELYEWLYEHFKDKYPAVHNSDKFYPAKNRRPIIFRVIKIESV